MAQSTYRVRISESTTAIVDVDTATITWPTGLTDQGVEEIEYHADAIGGPRLSFKVAGILHSCQIVTY